jgi:TolA-binding protein
MNFPRAVRIFKLFSLSATGVLLVGPDAFPADPSPAQSKATSVLVQEVQDLLASGQFKESAEDLREILKRIDGLNDAESKATRSSFLYQLGLCQMKSADYAGSAETFRKFITEYPADELIPTARFMVLEAYARQNNREQMSAWLAELKADGTFDGLVSFLADAKNAEFRRNTVLTLVTGYASQGDIENLRMFLPFCDDSVLADIGLNTALMEGGDKAFDVADYPKAMFFYRMVRLKNEILPACTKQIAALEAALAAPLPWVPAKERDLQAADRQADADRLEGLKQTVLFLDESGYELEVLIRRGQCLDAMKRYRQSLEFYSRIYTQAPEHRLAEQSRALAFQALLALDDLDAAIQAGKDYLARHPQGRYEDEITVGMMQLYLMRNEPSLADELGQRALDALPNRRLADQMTHLLGVARLQQQRWSEALTLFSAVKEKWPQSSCVQDADYWGGMCYLFEGRFADAIDVFSAYLKNPAYRPLRLAADATYRLGVAQYGAEEFVKAEGTFKEFLVLYPESQLISEAYSMLGDLRGAEGDLELALTLYQQAVQKAVDSAQDSYAVFQAARVYEMQQRYTETVDLVKAYIARRGTEARLAEAALWIGKSCKAQGNQRQSLEIYIKTLADFGNDPLFDGIDPLLIQLYDDLKSGVSSADSAFAKTRLTEELTRARQKNERALVLRIAALLARISTGAEQDLYIAELAGEKNPEVFSPLPLAVLAESYAQRGDLENAQRAADDFQARFPKSDLLIGVLTAQASACLKAQDYAKTVLLTQEVLDRFDGDARIGLCRKLQADAYRLSGDWKKAAEMYQKIFSVRANHGALAPEVLYWIGVCRRELGETEKAFAFFQRVYVLYGGYPEWTAKAYEASAECLQKLGRADEAAQTWKEMIANPSVQNTPEGLRAAESLRKAGKE